MGKRHHFLEHGRLLISRLAIFQRALSQYGSAGGAAGACSSARRFCASASSKRRRDVTAIGRSHTTPHSTYSLAVDSTGIFMCTIHKPSIDILY
ncbi:hypothetical protein EVAR_87103_1 [Eumeta japonica]|uniref:Uncharacterized protein n=1 Tax=Eumeta variegata TaxID=151549 RepID=A0A4C1TEZ8_EUMVA|nr:hypothetical protein EVAR_87103_1 [Eumeta japonica]